MSDLSNRTRELLETADGQDDPTGADRERVRGALALQLAAGVGAGAAVSAAGNASAAGAGAAGAAAGAGKAVFFVKVAVVAALVTGGGLGLWQLTRSTGSRPLAASVALQPTQVPTPVGPEIPPPVATIDAPARDAGPALPSVPVPPPGDRARAQVVSRPRAIRPETAPPAPPAPRESRTQTLERETAALRAVRTALRDHDAPAAFAALEAYGRDFPEGLLAEEADALRVEALCALGHHDDAARAAASFLSRYPRSLHTARVERGCEGDPTP